MKRVLILCDSFPPAFGPRMGYLCKYLKQAGWQAEVIAEKMEDDTFAFLADSFPVTFVSYYTAKNKFLRKLQWFFTLLADYLFSYKDRKMAKAARKVCRRRAFDLVLCSSYRAYPLTAARLTSQRHHLPLVVDLRDIIEQYAGNEFLAHSFHLFPWLNKRMTAMLKRKLLDDRNRALRVAAHVTTVSPWHVEQLKRYNPNVSLIYNGYDPELFYPQDLHTDQFSITYTGRLISLETRDPSLLFEAVSTLNREGLIDPGLFRIKWYIDPKSEEIIKRIASPYSIGKYMDFYNYVPASRIPDILNSSSILLQLANKFTPDGSKGIMTTKLFEYMAVEKPILCIPSDESYMEGIIRKTRSGMAARNAEDAARFILDNYEEWRKKGFTATTPDREEIKQFSRKRQAGQFMRLFETVSSSAAT